jgi:hypothetical protein
LCYGANYRSCGGTFGLEAGRVGKIIVQKYTKSFLTSERR